MYIIYTCMCHTHTWTHTLCSPLPISCVENNGFTCIKCCNLRRAIRNAHTRADLRTNRQKLRSHLHVVFAARKALTSYKFGADQDEGFVLIMADAADQAKIGSPSIRQGGRAGSKVKKIKQQFIGVILHGRGYRIYRRLPVTPKGANLTCTILIDLFNKGLLKKCHTLCIQWDGLWSWSCDCIIIWYMLWLQGCDSNFLHSYTIHACMCDECTNRCKWKRRQK